MHLIREKFGMRGERRPEIDDIGACGDAVADAGPADRFFVYIACSYLSWCRGFVYTMVNAFFSQSVTADFACPILNRVHRMCTIF